MQRRRQFNPYLQNWMGCLVAYFIMCFVSVKLQVQSLSSNCYKNSMQKCSLESQWRDSLDHIHLRQLSVQTTKLLQTNVSPSCTTTFRRQLSAMYLNNAHPCSDDDDDDDDNKKLSKSNCYGSSKNIISGRRSVVKKCIRYAATTGIVVGATVPYESTNAALFSSDQDRRQLEVCLVTLLRVMYWAQRQAIELDTIAAAASSTTSDMGRQRALYLETRLGAKAALTGRISGGGATSRVYTLATLQLPACLVDLEWHALHQYRRQENSNNSLRKVSELCLSFRESLASIVEFDGLDTLTDPSPRATLTLTQYNTNKVMFVRRTLNELTIPVGQKLAAAFGPEPYQRSISFVQQYYSNEIGPSDFGKRLVNE
jgi:hypothetical protein